MEVDLDGLTVRAPRWVTLSEIEAALAERANWIVKALAEWRAPPPRRDAARVEVRRADPLSRPRAGARGVSRRGARTVAPDLFHLTVLHPHAHDERQVAELVGKWLQRRGVERSSRRRSRRTRSGSRPRRPPMRLSNARSEWGSCNARGEIRLNWRLVQLPPALAEYVVAHEVAHLVELNHSPRFWAIVETLMPGHAALRRELEDWTALLAA